MSGNCAAPLDWDTLLAYRLGELAPEADAQLEQHYLGCDLCSGRLAELEALADRARQLVRGGGVDMVINDRLLAQLSDQGLNIREYRVPVDGAVNCTVAPQDDLVVARLEAVLGDVQRLDLVTIAAQGSMRRADIPFTRDSGGVLLAPAIEGLRALPATVLRMQLIAVDGNHQRLLGEYTFNHSPHPAA